MTEFQKKSFSVAMGQRTSDADRLEREGYVNKGGYWSKRGKLDGLLLPPFCPRCEKSDVSKIDAMPLYDWKMCKSCYIQSVEGKEEVLINTMIQIIMSTGGISKEDIRMAMEFINLPGAKRWVKNNWSSEKYKLMYDPEVRIIEDDCEHEWEPDDRADDEQTAKFHPLICKKCGHIKNDFLPHPPIQMHEMSQKTRVATVGIVEDIAKRMQEKKKEELDNPMKT